MTCRRSDIIRELADRESVAGWHLLVSATGCLRHEGFPYALDNGAWTAFQQGKPFDEALFVRALRLMGRDADWSVIPDIVAGGAASLEMSLRWMRQVLDETERGLIAVQDGMNVDDVRPFIGPRVGIFVGGSTAWKAFGSNTVHVARVRLNESSTTWAEVTGR